MKIINASYEIVTPIAKTRNDIMKLIEIAGRTCYKSEDRITEESASKFVRNLVKNGHYAMLEFADMTVKFTVDRGVSHELVRHRLSSFAQESTRFCNYGKTDEGVTFIRPFFFEDESAEMVFWKDAMATAEVAYLSLLKMGRTPQEARSVLPNSVKTEINVKANMREWRHIFALRACGTSGKPHPQMLEVMVPLLVEVKNVLPELFGDLVIPNEYANKYLTFELPRASKDILIPKED